MMMETKDTKQIGVIVLPPHRIVKMGEERDQTNFLLLCVLYVFVSVRTAAQTKRTHLQTKGSMTFA